MSLRRHRAALSWVSVFLGLFSKSGALLGIPGCLTMMDLLYAWRMAQRGPVVMYGRATVHLGLMAPERCMLESAWHER